MIRIIRVFHCGCDHICLRTLRAAGWAARHQVRHRAIQFAPSLFSFVAAFNMLSGPERACSIEPSSR